MDSDKSNAHQKAYECKFLLILFLLINSTGFAQNSANNRDFCSPSWFNRKLSLKTGTPSIPSSAERPLRDIACTIKDVPLARNQEIILFRSGYSGQRLIVMPEPSDEITQAMKRRLGNKYDFTTVAVNLQKLIEDRKKIDALKNSYLHELIKPLTARPSRSQQREPHPTEQDLKLRALLSEQYHHGPIYQDSSRKDIIVFIGPMKERLHSIVGNSSRKIDPSNLVVGGTAAATKGTAGVLHGLQQTVDGNNAQEQLCGVAQMGIYTPIVMYGTAAALAGTAGYASGLTTYAGVMGGAAGAMTGASAALASAALPASVTVVVIGGAYVGAKQYEKATNDPYFLAREKVSLTRHSLGMVACHNPHAYQKAGLLWNGWEAIPLRSSTVQKKKP